MTRTKAITSIFAIVLVWGFLPGAAGGENESSRPAATRTTTNGGSLYPDYNTKPLPPDQTGMKSTAVEIARHTRLGLNIGNTLEATGGERGWGNPTTNKDLIDAAKANGFDAIRLPVSWNQYASRGTAKIDENWLDRVQQVLQYCVDNDLYVVLNVHWDGGWLENNVTPEKSDEVDARQRAFWQQIATRYRAFDEHLIFASANEPNVKTAEQMAVLLRYHQTFVDAVRSTGGRNAYRVLVVQGPDTDIKKTSELWQKMPIDTVPNKLMVEVHYYTPWNFTGMQKDENWGRQFFYWGKQFHSSTDTDHNATWGEEDDAAALFARMKQKFVDAGIPVVVGEFGSMGRDNLTGEDRALHRASRAHYVEYVTHLAVSNGMIPFYWDTGGLLDRDNGSVRDRESLDALLKGAGKQMLK